MLAVFTVSSLADSGVGSLRDALAAANATPGHDTVMFDAQLDGGTIQLESALSISESVTIDPTSALEILIDATAGDPTPQANDGAGIRAFEVVPFAAPSFGQAIIRNLSITGGDVTGPGGAIYATENLHVEEIHFHDNFATGDGGAVFIKSDAAAIVIASTFEDNASLGNGGAVFVDQLEATAYSGIITSEFRSNEAASEGGAIATRVGNGSFFIFQDVVATANQAERGGAIDAWAQDGGFVQLANVDARANVAAQGAGIRLLAKSLGTGMIFNSTFEFNLATAGVGGGTEFQVAAGEIRLSDTEFFANYAAGGGGGFYTQATEGDVVGNHLSVRGNSGSWGAGVRSVLHDSTFSLIESTLAENAGSEGGGMHAELGQDGRLEIDRSTIHANTALGNGGGLLLTANGQGQGTHLMRNGTISGNRADGLGAAVYLDSDDSADTFEILHSTIVHNNPLDRPATGGMVAVGPGTTILDHSLVGENVPATASVGDLTGNFVGSYNVIQSLTSGASLNGDDNRTGVAPRVAPLAANGGPTLTHQLMLDSAALNGGDPLFSNAVSHDQRGSGFSRVMFDRIDIGAIEREQTPTGDFVLDGTYDCRDIDLLVAAIAADVYSATLDMDLDGSLSQQDLDLWLALAGQQQVGSPFVRGDATLDGIVDGADFLVWNAHKFTPMPSWCAGDFNADGDVDGLDFLIWNANKFTSGWLSPIVSSEPVRETSTNQQSDAPSTVTASPSLSEWQRIRDDRLRREAVVEAHVTESNDRPGWVHGMAERL